MVGGTMGLGATGAVSAQESPTVSMNTKGDEYFFDPVGLHVEPGTTVTFENVSGTHNSVSYADRIPADASEWSTPVGETAEHTFEVSGTYDYYCQPHRTLGMVGRIVVGEPGGPADGSMPPDGDVPASSIIVEQGAVSFADFTAGGGAGGGDLRTALIGTGLLGGFTALAAFVYWIGNSEGERSRVGSPDWKRSKGRG